VAKGMTPELKLEGIRHYHRCTMKRLAGSKGSRNGGSLVVGIPCTVCSILDCPSGNPFHYSAEGVSCPSCDEGGQSP